MPWDPGSALQQAWEVVQVHWPVLVFAPLIAGICAGGPSMVLNQIHPGGTAAVAVWLAGTGLQWVLGAFFGAGVAKLLLAAARRKEPLFGEIFEGAPWFGKMIGTTFLLGVIGTGILILTEGPAGAILVRDLGVDALTDIPLLTRRIDHISPEFWLALVGGAVMMVILSVLVTMRLKFAEFYVVDAGHGPIEALGASWRATQGQVLKLLGFFVLVFLLTFAGLLACCIPVFVVTAVTRVAEALIYLHISGRVTDASSQA